MRHKKKGNHLSRTSSHKKALMRNMAAQVIEHKQIKTTVPKAKELRGFVERLITYAKKGSVHHRRLAYNFLQNRNAVSILFDELAPLYEGRNGGYTRIIKLGNRKGDAAPISIFQLVGTEKSVTPKSGDQDKKKKAKKEKKAEKETTAEEPETVQEEKQTQPDSETKAPADEETNSGQDKKSDE